MISYSQRFRTKLIGSISRMFCRKVARQTTTSSSILCFANRQNVMLPSFRMPDACKTRNETQPAQKRNFESDGKAFRFNPERGMLELPRKKGLQLRRECDFFCP